MQQNWIRMAKCEFQQLKWFLFMASHDCTM